MLDPVLASRLQFALTTIVHIVFPVMSMGLAPFLVYFTWREVRDADPLYERLRRFWGRVFAVSFVVGTVTGIVLEFEFGTNFAAFSGFVGQLFGGPLAVEGMMAFMLEATFLGVFLFGRERVSDRLYVGSAVAVGAGSWLSAVWILVANSWMQTPRGYEVVTEGGRRVVHLTDPLAAYLNPRFPWLFVHMQTAAVETVSLFMAGIAAYYVYKHHVRGVENDDVDFWETTLKVALVVLIVTAPLQIAVGDGYARHVYESQPQKFAAMEAVWQTEAHVPEYLVAFPTSVDAIFKPGPKELFGIGIPGGASWLASGGNASAVIQGLDSFPGDHPPVALVFWAFRAMVGLGFWFLLLAFWGGFRWWRGELTEDDLLHKGLMGSTLLGLVAVETGWVVTEVGRQPWVVTGVLRTTEGVSPGLTGWEATLTLAGFALGYLALLAVYTYVVVRIVRAGPPAREDLHTVASAASGAGATGADADAEVSGDD